MTKRQFLLIAFSLFAIYFAINLITNLNSYYDIIYQLRINDRQTLLTTACSILIALFLISILWIKSEWLMEKVFAIPVLSNKAKPATPESGQNEKAQISSHNPPIPNEVIDYYETPISAESIQLIVFSLIGIWAILYFLPSLLRELQVFLELSRSGDFISRQKDMGQNNIALLSSFIVVSLGIWLFLRPWQFQGWIEKFRSKKRPPMRSQAKPLRYCTSNFWLSICPSLESAT